MTPPLDPVTFEVVWHQLLDITEEMGIKYMRTSGSPVLVGAYDAATAIVLPDGQLVAMGPYISTQAHVFNLLVQATTRLRGGSPGIHGGDMWIVNDPYLGATHQPDVATLAPVEHDGRLRAWVASSGHWLDIGGSEPGGFNMNATTVYDEGLRLPPTRIVEDGEVRQDVVDLIMSNVREPLVELDLRGQIVSNESGRASLHELFDRHGVDVVEQVMRAGIDHSERRLRARLLELPDGVWREVQYLDHDGHRAYRRPIVCTMTKRGDRIVLDFTGSAPEAAGFANCAFGGLRAAALSGISVTLGYDLTWNDGIARCVEIVAPPRTIVTAEAPTPVSMSTISSVIVSLNLVLTTASRMLLASPSHHAEAMAAWCGTSIGYSLAGVNDRGIFTVCAESSHFAGGCGARTYADGVDTGGIIINTTANIASIEAMESEYPVLYLFRRQLTDSGGAGRFRGGLSAGLAVVPYGNQGPLETSFAAVGAQVPNGYGLAGGLPGATLRLLRFHDAGTVSEIVGGDRLPGELHLLPGNAEVMSSSLSRSPLPDGTIEYHNWQGAGGYGDPLERDPAQVAADVRDDAVSPEAALAVYGVVLRDGRADEAATEARRGVMRRERVDRARPAEEVVDAGDFPVPAWMAEVEPAGSLRYGDVLEVDFDADTTTCLRCGAVLGPARRDPRLGCLVEVSPPTDAGPVRGESYLPHDVSIRRYYCRCGRQIEADVVAGDHPRPAWILAGGANE